MRRRPLGGAVFLMACLVRGFNPKESSPGKEAKRNRNYFMPGAEEEWKNARQASAKRA